MVCCRGQYAGGVVLGFLSSTFCSQHWLQTCCDFTASTWQSIHGWSSPSAGATTIALTCCCGCDTLRQPHCPSAQTSCRVSSSQMGRRTTLHGMLTTARWARRRVCRGTLIPPHRPTIACLCVRKQPWLGLYRAVNQSGAAGPEGSLAAEVESATLRQLCGSCVAVLHRTAATAMPLHSMAASGQALLFVCRAWRLDGC